MLATSGLNILIGLGVLVQPELRYLISVVAWLTCILTFVIAGWGTYFFFQHHDRMLACDRSIRIFAEVGFYFAFVASCLLACLLCCMHMGGETTPPAVGLDEKPDEKPDGQSDG